jgi:molybdate transport system regulatory protein
MEGELEAEIQSSLVGGKLACAQAFRIAKKLKVSPREVGDAANRLNIRIASCQLGCFP